MVSCIESDLGIKRDKCYSLTSMHGTLGLKLGLDQF